MLVLLQVLVLIEVIILLEVLVLLEVLELLDVLVILEVLVLVLPKLIDNDQTGFLKGRFIGENIRPIDSVINFTAGIKSLLYLSDLSYRRPFTTLILAHPF